MQYQQVLQASCPSGQLLTGIDPNGAPHCASPRVEAGASSGKSLSIDPSGAVAHLVMNAPASGYAFVTATFDVSVDNANTDCSVASQIASAPGIPSSGPAFQDFNYPGSINTRSVGGTQLVSHGSITTAVAVNAGANSLYLNGFNDCNAADWSNVNITAVYFAAGAVSRLVVP